MRYVQLMRSKCPTLQYVQIQRHAWHITAPPSGVPILEAYAESQVELRELEWDERMYIELFAIDTFPMQSGLPGPEEFQEEMGEDEELRIEQLLAEQEARIAAGDPELMELIDGID